MHASRREFTCGTLGLAIAGPAAAKAAAPSPRIAAALREIADYADAHRRFFSLPALTLSLTTPDGFTTTIDRGFADLDVRRPISAATLFQIGSITKSFTASLFHQFAAEGRLRLSDDARSLLPDAGWPDTMVTLQHLLDHDSGLPEDGPAHRSSGRLWLGYAPGAHWSYSNIGYVLLGRIAERVGGMPLGRQFTSRMLAPLGMAHSRGAVIAADRLLYAQAYEPFDLSRPYVRGTKLRPAPWMDIGDGSGSIASTAADMVRYLRSLAGAAGGHGGFGLSPERGLAFTRHAVASGEGDMRYGNGLMHVADAGVAYIHHTGGGPFGSASFHLDPATGIGAFAGSTISAFADYRPTMLTLFAVKALTAARSRRPLPAPPPFVPALPHPEAFSGRYASGARAFTVRAGQPLMLASAGRQTELQNWGEDLFRTAHPDFADFALKFERSSGRIVAASWGPDTLLREGAGGARPASDPALALLAGRFGDDNTLGGVVQIVERGGRLWLGTDTPMTRLDRNLWRVGAEPWWPERAEFADFADRRPHTVTLFGQTFERREV